MHLFSSLAAIACVVPLALAAPKNGAVDLTLFPREMDIPQGAPPVKSKNCDGSGRCHELHGQCHVASDRFEDDDIYKKETTVVTKVDGKKKGCHATFGCDKDKWGPNGKKGSDIKKLFTLTYTKVGGEVCGECGTTYGLGAMEGCFAKLNFCSSCKDGGGPEPKANTTGTPPPVPQSAADKAAADTLPLDPPAMPSNMDTMPPPPMLDSAPPPLDPMPMDSTDPLSTPPLTDPFATDSMPPPAFDSTASPPFDPSAPPPFDPSMSSPPLDPFSAPPIDPSVPASPPPGSASRDWNTMPPAPGSDPLATSPLKDPSLMPPPPATDPLSLTPPPSFAPPAAAAA